MKITLVSMLAALGAVIAAPTARAQSVFDSELRIAPQYIQYWLGAPSDETISQIAIPLFIRKPDA